MKAWKPILRDISNVCYSAQMSVFWLLCLGAAGGSRIGLASSSVSFTARENTALALKRWVSPIEGASLSVGRKGKGLSIMFDSGPSLDPAGNAQECALMKKLIVSPDLTSEIASSIDPLEARSALACSGIRLAKNMAAAGKDPEAGYWIAYAEYISSFIHDRTGVRFITKPKLARLRSQFV